MKTSTIVLSFATLGFLTGCSAPEAGAKPVGWTHANAASWGDLSSDYAACKTGLMQSPIDLAPVNVKADFGVTTNYRSSTATALNKGYTVQVDFKPGQKMVTSGMEFDLLQFHMHTPSEHVISGEPFPLVSHFVHANESGDLAVLGVMFEEGDANTELQKVIDALSGGADSAEITLDNSQLIPTDLTAYRYMGSLTTPPCSEGVNWHVAKIPLTASQAQIEALEGFMGMTARPIQPHNHRLLLGSN